MACAVNSIPYNGSLCACPPGYVQNPATKEVCTLFTANTTITTDSGVDYYAVSFPETIFAFDSIKKLTQSQAVFLEATLFMLISWLLLCFLLRFTNVGVGDGRNIWFDIRWWIRRLDICFATRHWLDDQKVVRKRKTELGGTFSIASWILFIGLFASLLYQMISKRTIEVHNVRATNGPELASFMIMNDMEFNITTVSGMSCSNLRDLGNLVTGNPGFVDQRVVPLSTLANYSCYNSSKGPTITVKCKNCMLVQDRMYISWQFVDLPNNPATAVGFEFNLTAMDNAKKHMSFVCGTLKNGSAFDDRPVTFRGRGSNILKFNLFPRIYHNLHDLKLIQPLFHEFLPGSVFRDRNHLGASLENSLDGLINTTLYINLLSDYIVEIDEESIRGPVSFLADLGGLYCISMGIFFYLLIQCEYRIKKLRNEDSILRTIRNRRKAKEHWSKLRKYVMYTWGSNILEENSNSNSNSKMGSSCIHGNGSSSRKRRQESRKDSISSCQDFPLESVTDNNLIPPPPSLGFKGVSEVDMSDIHEYLTSLYEYNVMLREKLIATQSLLQSSSFGHSA